MVETNPKLTICEDCQREISRRAETCPHCGARTPYGEKMEEERSAVARRNVRKEIYLDEARGAIWGGVVAIISVVVGTIVLYAADGLRGLPIVILITVVGILGLVSLVIGLIWRERYKM